MSAFPEPLLEKRQGALRRPWSGLSFLAFLFQLGLQDEGGEQTGGWGAKSSALAYSSD